MSQPDNHKIVMCSRLNDWYAGVQRADLFLRAPITKGVVTLERPSSSVKVKVKLGSSARAALLVQHRDFPTVT